MFRRTTRRIRQNLGINRGDCLLFVPTASSKGHVGITGLKGLVAVEIPGTGPLGAIPPDLAGLQTEMLRHI
eukprot:5254032-Amphidinium_carterae.1